LPDLDLWDIDSYGTSCASCASCKVESTTHGVRQANGLSCQRQTSASD